MFGTCTNYVTLRLLGQDPNDTALAKGREWILSHGGATLIPEWGKIWLSVRVKFLLSVAELGRKLRGGLANIC